MDGVALHRPSTRYDEDESHSNASDHDYDDGLDAAREEEQRYKRYLNASQLHSGELQGLYQTEAPSLSTQRHGLNNNGRLAEQSSAASVDEGPSRTEASESDYSGKPPLQHLGSFGVWGEGQQGEDARSPNGTPLPPLREEPAGVEEDRPSSRATSHDGAPGGPTTMWSNVTFQPDTSHAHDQALPTPKTTPFQQPAGLPPGIFGSQNGRGQAHAQLSHAGSQRVSSEQVASGKAQARGSGAGPALGTMSPKPSERLGHSLGAGDRERMTSQASQEPPPRRGSIETGMKSELLGDLPPEQQMVLSFTRISSWVQVGNLGKPQLPLKARLKPAHLASACFKPVKSTAQGVAKVGTAAGSGVQRLTSRMLVRRHKPEDARTDIEAGGGDLGKPGAVTASSAPKEGYRQILHALSGTVKPGHVLALMGPSGSGKTSLLSIIGGRAPGSVKLEGSVTVNGMKLNKAVRRRIGFVLQDDVLYETLTVQETLQYAGLLRLPRTMSRTDKMARVDAVISVLGLTKSKDTIIGGYFRRGISGGERKRVSVGHELLINPAVLLLDEPTSGLDSTTALHLVKLLRDLAAGGRAILTTIHQPSSRLYRKLDKVMLLAEGHVMYYGDALRAVDWFDHLGFGLPYGTNLADHILDCAMGEVMYNPQAPGANGSVGKQSAGGGRERSMHGGNAVRSLYTTFEQWYANHPDGFTVEQSPAAGQLPMGGTHSPRAVSRASSSLLIHSLLEDVSLTHCPRRSLMGTAPTADGSANHAASAAAGAGAAGTKTAAAPAVTPGTVVVRVHGDNRATDGTSPSPGGTAGGTVGTSEQPQSLALSSSSSTDSSSSATAGVPAKGKQGNYVEVRGGAGFFQQVSVLWQRALKVRRFESLSGQQLFQLVGVAVITGLLWWQRGSSGDVAGATDVEGLLFFEMLFVAFRSLFSALFTFPNEFRMLSKERPSGMYKLSAYYIARTLADLPIEVMYPSLYVIIIYWFGGLRATAAAFFGNYLSTLVIVLVAQCWGLLLGGLFMDPKMAQTVTTVLMLTFLLVGGFYVRDVPVWIGWLKYLSFVYWGNRLLIKVEFQGRSLTDCAAAQPGQPCPVIPSDQLEEVLRLPCDPNQGVYPEVLVLIGMLVLLRWITYLVLRWKTSSQQKAL